MPYTKTSDRVKFKDHIMEIVDAVMGGNEAIYVKGEYFGFWVNRVTKNFIRDPQAHSSSFNSVTFNADKLRKIAANADKVAALVDATDPINSAGDLNYVLTAVYLGVSGECTGIEKAKYGFRAYLKGMLGKIHTSIDSVSIGNQREVTMSFRRHVIARGVLSDVIDEFYWISTREYEDAKMLENGSIWVEGSLVLP